MTKRAVVLEAKGGICTVLTADGEFRSLKMRGSFRPGQEIILPESRWRINRLALVAACLLLFFTATATWRTVMAPAVAAYVSLDINPAVELALDGKNVVCGVKPLDDDGKELVEGLELNGMDLEKAVERLIAAAVGKEYISADEGNIIVFTVTPVGQHDSSQLDRLVRESVETSLVTLEVKAQVLVGSAPPEIREKAQKEGVPPGRYMMFLDASKKGMSVNLEDFKKKSIPSIERDKKIKVKNGLEVEKEDEGKIRRESRRDGGEDRDRDDREDRNARKNNPGNSDPDKEQVKGGVEQDNKSRQEGREQREEKEKKQKEEKEEKEKKEKERKEKEEKERKEKEEKDRKEKERKKESGQFFREQGKGPADQDNKETKNEEESSNPWRDKKRQWFRAAGQVWELWHVNMRSIDNDKN